MICRNRMNSRRRASRAGRVRIGLTAAVVTAIALSACSSPSPEQEFLPGPRTSTAPSADDGLPQVDLGMVVLTWPQDDGTLFVTTRASSSCPLVPREFEGAESAALVLAPDTAGSSVCSADLAPTTTAIDRPSLWIPSANYSVENRDDTVVLSIK